MSERLASKYLAFYINNNDSKDYEYIESEDIPEKIKTCREKGTLIQILHVTKENVVHDYLGGSKNGFIETVYRSLVRNNMRRFPSKE